MLTVLGVFYHLVFLRRTMRREPVDTRVYQARKLRYLLIHCQRNIPYYQHLFSRYDVDAYDSDSFSQLAKLPVLKKEDVREAPSVFLDQGATKRAIQLATSGTTGHPMQTYTSKTQWIVEQGVVWRHWRLAGYRFRDRMAIFRSYSPRSGQPLMHRDVLRNWTYFAVSDLSDEILHEYFRYLENWRPKFIRGYPSSLDLIARFALRHDIKIPSLKAAFTASETLSGDTRSALKAAFGIEVFDHYGQAEITCMLHECQEHSGLHNNDEYGVCELVEDTTSGDWRIIATNLHNFAMPLLRYDTGDLTQGYAGQCPCGWSSVKVVGIKGRADNYLINEFGNNVPTVNMYTYFSKLSEIKRFQVVQSERGKIKVMIQFWEGIDGRDRQLATIASSLSEMFRVAAECFEAEQFHQSVEGKFSTFIQQVPPSVD